MKPNTSLRRAMMAILSIGVVSLAALGSTSSRAGEREDGYSMRDGRDSLFVGEASDNTVRQFRAKTGKYEGVFVKPSGTPPGEVLHYSGRTGEFLGKLVAADDPNAPAAPRGMVLWNDRIIFVADFSTTLNPCTALADLAPGRILAYRLTEDRKTGRITAKYHAVLTPPAEQFRNQFNPRGLVIGPDGLLYVSNVDLKHPNADGTNVLGGHVLRFDPKTLQFVDVFVSSDAGGDFAKLNRPEGLVFSPHGNLYITGYRNDCKDTDKILIFHGPNGRHAGAFLDQIVLDGATCPPNEPANNLRAYGVTLLFGPNGRLFVPITGAGPDTGEVRRYDVGRKTFDVFVAPSEQGGPLPAPWYLTFGKTDPATLLYEDGQDHGERWSREY